MHTRKLLLHINYNILNSLETSCSYRIPGVFKIETLNAKDMQILNMIQLFSIILKRKGRKNHLDAVKLRELGNCVKMCCYSILFYKVERQSNILST